MLTNFSVAFYNLENLFDTKNDQDTLDKDYSSGGSLGWNQDRYKRKIQNLSNVISKIGLKYAKLPPIFIGVSEVEKKDCLLDLIKSEKLVPYNYDFVHYDSPDERGIDVAFLYQKKYFELISSKAYPLYLTDEKNNRDYTRDILLVFGKIFNKPIYILVNHWPSRNKGINYSDHKRVKAAALVRNIIAEIYKENNNPNIIIMGDFNDEPNDNSIKNHLLSTDLFNPMNIFKEQNKGSVKYRGKWYMFDQIIISNSFLSNSIDQIKFKKADIFDPYFIQEQKGKFKGSPKRTYVGKWHQGGFSDHFPVLVYFQKVWNE